MSRPDTWMPLYVGDWESDTLHLTCEEDGAYGRLVRWYWRNGPPPDDDQVLARIVRETVQRWRKLRPALVVYFTVESGRWRHSRVDRELAKSRRLYAASVENGRKGGRPRKTQDKPDPKPSTEPSENTTHTLHLQGEKKEDLSQGDDQPPALRIVPGGRS